ncbi:MAG: hypothetical protein Q9222_004639, partial [Ikaeria aurantiellina]
MGASALRGIALDATVICVSQHCWPIGSLRKRSAICQAEARIIFPASSLTAGNHPERPQLLAPPLGNLRWAKPIPPQQSNSSIGNGTPGRICPGVVPTWLGVGGQFLEAYVKNEPFDFDSVNKSFYAGLESAKPPLQDPRTTEDCLFLDVIVPRKTFEGTGRLKNSTAGSPVLVWIYGGGFSYSDKTGYGNPAGLIRASNMSQAEEVIFVAFNYRLGVLGWLAGSSLQANGTANVGLYDQRLALEWVQSNIHLFGGDPSRVTVMGESAGGASVLLQITAFGGSQGPAPFQQAIIQSPAWVADIGVDQQENLLSDFLKLLDVSTIQEARQLDSATLIQANHELVGNSPYGTFIADPVVDGNFIPDQPSSLFHSNAFDQNVKVMHGHQLKEGVVFTRPYAMNDSAFSALTQFWLPNANSSVLTHIAEVLYPPTFDGTLPYKNQLDRAITFVSEYIVTCHNDMLNMAFRNETYGYQFSVPPAVHAQDTDYTFYNGPGAVDPYMTYNVTVAQTLQQYITSFAIEGTPSGRGDAPPFPAYGMGTLLNLTDIGLMEVQDPTANERCSYLQRIPGPGMN